MQPMTSFSFFKLLAIVLASSMDIEDMLNLVLTFWSWKLVGFANGG